MTTRAAAIVVLASTLSWPAMSASLWQHNGSIVSLEASGTARKFSYETPRPGLNVSPGALLFDGVKNGDTYSGTAFEFSRSCPPAGYQVSGSVSSNQQVVTMTGDAPVRDTACKIVGSKPSNLVFTYVRTAPFASADDVKSKPRDQSVSVTPKAVEQDGAGDSAQQDQCQLPKEANYVFFDTSGFAVRTSASNQDDKNIAFQIHSVEIDDPARASVEYFAVEHITPAESNWIIQIHVDDNLEYVFVPVKRLWELRFTATENDSSKAESNVEEYRSLPLYPNDFGTIPCFQQIRANRIQQVLSLAMQKLKSNDLSMARKLFYYVLRLDSLNAPAMYYYSESLRLSGFASDKDTAWRLGVYYTRARTLGIGADQDAWAAKQIELLNRMSSE